MQPARHTSRGNTVSLIAHFAPDGRTLAVVSEEGLKLWDIPNARLAKTLDVWVCGRDSYCSVPSQIEFDRDGTLWALRGGFLHWGADGSALPVPKLPEYPAPGDYWSNFSLPAFGDLVAVGGYDQSLIVNRGNSAAAKDAIEGTALFFDPAAATLFLDKRNRIDALDMATRKIRFSLPGSDSPNRSAFSEKNHEVLISYHRGEFRYSRHIPGGSMRLWSTASGRPLATIRAIDGTDDSYVMTEGPNARIEFFGDTGRARAFCRSGPLTLPFAACAERFEVTGLLEKQRSGDLTYLDP